MTYRAHVDAYGKVSCILEDANGAIQVDGFLSIEEANRFGSQYVDYMEE